MAMEPITLFSRIVDPVGVVRKLRDISPSVEIDGPDDSWRRAVVTIGKDKAKKTLTFTHDLAYYQEPNWSGQMSGMRGYFSRFPDTDAKEKVLVLTTSLRFCLGTLFDPDFDPDEDERLAVLFEITEMLDGVLFTPSTLRDARGRILFGGGEDEEDSEAVWPRVLGEVSFSNTVRRPESTDANQKLDAPSSERVARRALALTAVAIRALLEQDVANHLLEIDETYAELLDWIKQIGIGDELEADEWEAIQRQPGHMEMQMQISTTWRLESLVVLAWALGRFKIPPHDQLVAANPLCKSLAAFDVDAATHLLESPTLRSREDIAALRRRTFALHWRLRNFYLNPSVLDFADFARTCWFGPLDITDLPLIDGDLALQGRRIDEADPDTFASAHSAALERHKAANWLWEGPAKYRDASVAT